MELKDSPASKVTQGQEAIQALMAPKDTQDQREMMGSLGTLVQIMRFLGLPDQRVPRDTEGRKDLADQMDLQARQALMSVKSWI